MDKSIYDNYVLKVVEYGSLSKAAASLGITQPALSYGIKSLETKLGITIFNRKKSPLTLTDEGKIYYDYLTRIVTLTEDLNSRLSSCISQKDSSVVIGGAIAYTESIIADAVCTLRKEMPNCRITVKSKPLAELVEMTKAGEMNCFIATSCELPSNFEAKFIRNENVYLCVPKSSPFCENPTDYSLLNNENFIFLDENLPLQKSASQFLKDKNLTPNSFVCVDQAFTAIRLASMGEGACFATEEALRSLENKDNICVFPLDNEHLNRKLYIAYDKDLYMPYACNRLISIIMDGCKNER